MNSATADPVFPALYSPQAIGPLALANRIAVAPMTRISAGPGGTATAQMAAYYAAYAKGGFGLVMTEGVYIDERHSQGYVDQPGIANDRQQDSWRQVVDAVHAEGVPVFIQLLHAGALIQHNDHVTTAIAPSAVQPVGEMAPHYKGRGRFGMPREMSQTDIDDVIRAFGAAARRAAEAGFDGVEIHGANGYILDQFLTSYTNKRNDAYGGPVERRVRFHAEVVEGVREALDGKIPFGVRISQTKVNDLSHSWAGGTSDAQAIFGAIGDAAPSYIHVNAHHGFDPVFGSDKSLAQIARETVPQEVAIIACGKLNDPARANTILSDGISDIAAIAKGALADPQWPLKIRRGEDPCPFDPDMIRPFATIDNTDAWRRARIKTPEQA